MRRLALVSLALVLALGAGVSVAPARAADRERPSAAQLESELVCVTCKSTLDQSDAPFARRVKAYIRRRIAEGARAAQIKRELVAQFGDEVLAEPPRHGVDLLAWVLPIGGIALGALGVGALAWGWSRRARDGGAPPGAEALDPELERRMDEELARFDA